MSAPDFDNEGYPTQGERIGPAWEAGWSIIDPERWTLEDDVVKEMVRHQIAPKTALNIIRQARMAGVVGTKRIGNAWLYRRSVLWTN